MIKNTTAIEFVFTPGTKLSFRKDVVMQVSLEEAKVYVGLKNRTPLVGKFVFLEDGEELYRKNLVRFVTQQKMPLFDIDENRQFTIIMSIEVFTEIKKM